MTKHALLPYEPYNRVWGGSSPKALHLLSMLKFSAAKTKPCKYLSYSVADPGFPKARVPTFCKMCMSKRKNHDHWGRGYPPLDPAMILDILLPTIGTIQFSCQFVIFTVTDRPACTYGYGKVGSYLVVAQYPYIT